MDPSLEPARSPGTGPVRLAVGPGGARRAALVRIEDPAATVADLAAALDPAGRRRALRIGDRAAPAAAVLASLGLRHGTTVTPFDPRADRPRPLGPPCAALAVDGGLHAGPVHVLPAGLFVVGRAATADIRGHDTGVAPHHALIQVGPDGTVVVGPLGPGRVVRVAGVEATAATPVPVGAELDVGGTRLRRVAVPPPAAVRPRRPRPGEWTVPFHRPPRAAPPGAPAALVGPAATYDERSWTSGGLVALVVSLTGAVVVAVVLRQPLLLLVGGIGVLGTLATRVQARRRDRREATARARQRVEEGRRFVDTVVARRAADAARHRAAHPDLPTLVGAALRAEPPLWARRADDADAFVATVGRGAWPWRPELVAGATTPDALAVLAAHDHLPDAAVPVALGPGRVVGIAGDGRVARAVARAIVVQLACLHGPADLTIGVAAMAPNDARAWGWVRWLPHVSAATGGPDGFEAAVVASGEVGAERVVAALVERRGDRRVACLVVDGAALAIVRNGAVRRLLAGRTGPATGIVVASRADELPAVCTTVVEVTADGRVRVHGPQAEHDLADVTVTGVDEPTAEAVALALAGLDDTDSHSSDAGLPDHVGLLALLGPDAIDGECIAARWSTLGADPAPRAPMALAADGPVVLDLVRDGPHGLVAGTTGAGKSELLRALVVALAVRCRPQDLTFVLVDYKGGSAFDGCAALPHVVGLVTDLDEHLAARALRSLEAEIRHRERVLRGVGAVDLAAYRRVGGIEPLPRLVVVVDEFASMAGDLPDFLPSLVGIAQRGRSLGVHLLLATQRPAGVVSDDIRANTNVRLALRVHDRADSIDVLADPVAATIPRRRPGRAYVRLGPDELVAVQTARVTGPLAAVAGASRLSVRWIDHPSADASASAGPAGPERGPIESPDPVEPGGPTELDAIVAAVVDAHRRSGTDATPIRRPWLDPLPADVRLTELAPGAVALADDPDAQRRLAVGWDRSRGGLLVLGATGTGRSTALVTVALDLVRVHAPAALHLYALDMGAGALAPLAALPHCAAVVGADEAERRRRVVRRLRAELDRRRAAPGRWAEIVLLVDGYGALVAAHDDPAGYELLDDLERIAVDGPQVGITMAASAERPAAVPSVVAATVTQKWVLRLADRGDASLAGVTDPPGPGAPPGRAVAAGSGLELQIAWTGPDRAAAVAAVVATWPEGDEGRPAPITTLPHCVRLAALPAAVGAARPWLVPVGIGDRHLAPVSLALHAGDHVLVSGPSRAGRSNALALLARQVRTARPDALVIGVVARRSPLGGHPALDVELVGVEGLAAALAASGAERPAIVLVDDADLVDDAPRVLTDVVTGGHGPDVHVVAAGRTEGLRAAYGHWTQLVRRSRLGVLLRPQPDVDGDLLGVTLPRREVVAPVAGRGYLVADGGFELVQLALADSADEPR